MIYSQSVCSLVLMLVPVYFAVSHNVSFELVPMVTAANDMSPDDRYTDGRAVRWKHWAKPVVPGLFKTLAPGLLKSTGTASGNRYLVRSGVYSGQILSAIRNRRSNGRFLA